MKILRRTGVVCGLIAVLILSPRTGAEGVPTDLDLFMTMTMAGVSAGELKLSIDTVEDGVASSLKMKSQGLFRLITGYKSKAKAMSALHSETGAPRSVSFDSRYETNKSDRRVAIRYHPDDGRIVSLENWKRGKPRDSKVPQALREGAVDPLTAVLQLRHWIREHRNDRGLQTIGTGQPPMPGQTLEVFDGRRRYRLDLEFLDRPTVRYDGERRPALRFRVELQPLAGFSSKDMLANWANEDGQRWVELIVTDEDDPAPYSMKTQGGGLKTEIHLRKICRGQEGCRTIDG